MPFSSSGLPPSEREMVEKLVEASQCLESIYWRQSDPGGLSLYQSTRDPGLRRLLMIHGGRFDLLDDYRPFAGSEPMSPGRRLYPIGVTPEVIEQYVREHPDQKDELYSPYTIIERQAGDLMGRPYHETFRRFLEAAADKRRCGTHA